MTVLIAWIKNMLYLCTGIKNNTVMTSDKYRNPNANVVDIEVMANVSYGTARRIMCKIRKHFGIPGRQHPTMVQVREFLRQ